MSNSADREVEVFTEAKQLSSGQRAAYLDQACAGDETLRRRVEGLLRADEMAGQFLNQSPHPTTSHSRRNHSVGEKPGDCIGRYKLLQQIGEGGCGVVFMAEQQEPVQRRVALKIIKPGMDTKSVIARFEAERQALAMMDHPNIAKVFDAGATDSGRPYFVMELIRGVKITEYCDQHSLLTEQRLNLFAQVCQAIQHAHQKGIIHRDIKPSNILVATSAQGEAMPMVIDFGIAKATTNQQLTDKTLFTAFEMLIGTPAYMSPEQAAMTNADVDTRTDIYSLGVLLYELLTGSTPFNTEQLLKSGLDEIRRVIREQEPARPSTRLSRMAEADLTAVAQRRQSDAPKLIRSVRGELDWIVMKAVEKDPCRRYETANGLALDVRRFLANEAVSACPPSQFYRFQKWVLRHKLLVISSCVIALLVISSLVMVSLSLARERQARRTAAAALLRAKADQTKAEKEAAKSQQVTRFLEDMLQSVGPSVARGRDTTILREILERTSDRVSQELASQPDVQAELTSLIGRVYHEIGNYKQAEHMQRLALDMNRALFGSESRQVATSLDQLGLTLWREGKLDEPKAAYQEALEIQRQLFGEENADVATSLSYLADVYRHQGNVAEAEKLTRQALAIRQKLFGDNSLAVADSLRSLSILLGDELKRSESETMARRVLAIRRKLLGPNDPLVASSLDDVAWAAGYQGKLQEAESLEREALEIRRKALGDVHPDVAKSLYLLGDRLRQEGNLAQSYSFLNAALSIQERLLGGDNPALLNTLRSLSLTLQAQGRLAEAETMAHKALALYDRQGESATPQAMIERGNLAKILIAENKIDMAEKTLNEALTPEVVRQVSSSALLALRAGIRARQGLWKEAAKDASLALAYEPKNSSPYSMAAALQVKTRNLAAYEQLRRQLLDNDASTTNVFVADQVAKACLFLPPNESDLVVIERLADLTVTRGAGDQGAMPFFEVCKALAEYRAGHYQEALEWAQKSAASTRLEAYEHAYAVQALACWKLGRTDAAEDMLSKGEALAPRAMPANVVMDSGNKWQAWLFARITLDEAEAVIRSPSVGGGPAE